MPLEPHFLPSFHLIITSDGDDGGDGDGDGDDGDDGNDVDDGDYDGVNGHKHLGPSELGQPDTILVWLAAGA